MGLAAGSLAVGLAAERVWAREAPHPASPLTAGGCEAGPWPGLGE